jgi:hypothetical protein
MADGDLTVHHFDDSDETTKVFVYAGRPGAVRIRMIARRYLEYEVPAWYREIPENGVVGKWEYLPFLSVGLEDHWWLYDAEFKGKLGVWEVCCSPPPEDVVELRWKVVSMANDKVFLVCKHCRRAIAFMNYYPNTGLYWVGQEERLTNFISEHSKSCNRPVGVDLGGDTRFELLTEGALSEINEKWACTAPWMKRLLKKRGVAVQAELE